MRLFLIGIALSCVISGCFSRESTEIVMREGMVIEAINGSDSINIEASTNDVRIYQWDGKKKMFRLRPRDCRWYGSMGLYRPSGDGEIHAVLEEGQQHFCSEEEVYPWLAWLGEDKKPIYTSDGLVVSWRKERDPSGSRYALLVDVWQIYINGSKPRSLKGASDDSIKITYKNHESPPIAAGGLGLERNKIINGRWYLCKAVEVMRQKNISADMVEKVISEGEGNFYGPYRCYSGLKMQASRFHFSVWVDKDGRVLLLI